LAEGAYRQPGCPASYGTRRVKKWLPRNSIIDTTIALNNGIFHHGTEGAQRSFKPGQIIILAKHHCINIKKVPVIFDS